jgi:hypothetical protein
MSDWWDFLELQVHGKVLWQCDQCFGASFELCKELAVLSTISANANTKKSLMHIFNPMDPSKGFKNLQKSMDHTLGTIALSDHCFQDSNHQLNVNDFHRPPPFRPLLQSLTSSCTKRH